MIAVTFPSRMAGFQSARSPACGNSSRSGRSSRSSARRHRWSYGCWRAGGPLVHPYRSVRNQRCSRPGLPLQPENFASPRSTEDTDVHQIQIVQVMNATDELQYLVLGHHQFLDWLGLRHLQQFGSPAMRIQVPHVPGPGKGTRCQFVIVSVQCSFVAPEAS